MTHTHSTGDSASGHTHTMTSRTAFVWHSEWTTTGHLTLILERLEVAIPQAPDVCDLNAYADRFEAICAL